MTEEEIKGLLAFTLRTSGPEEVLLVEKTLDEPYDPAAANEAHRPDFSTEEARLAALRMAIPPPRRRRTGLMAGVVILLVALIGLAVAAFALDSNESAEKNGDLRGQEAQDAMQLFPPLETWKPRGEAQLSTSADSTSSYAFYRQSWTAPPDFRLRDFEAWFKALPIVQVHKDEASCETELAEDAMRCGVRIYARDAEGQPDYTAPSQSIEFRYQASAEAGVPPVEIHGEAYSSD